MFFLKKIHNPTTSIPRTSMASSSSAASSSAAAAAYSRTFHLLRRRPGLIALLLILLCFLSFQVGRSPSHCHPLPTVHRNRRNVRFSSHEHSEIRDSSLLIAPAALSPQVVIHVPSARSAVSQWLFSDRRT